MSLTAEQVDAFRRDGVLVADDVVSDADLAPVVEEYEAWVENKARELRDAGALRDTCQDLDFGQRFGCLYAQTPKIAEGMDVMHARGPATFAFLRNARLLDAVESLIGPEITCSPIQHIRAKPPAASAGEGSGFYNLPWHQDMAVTWREADESEIVTCWLPLVDATVENGCMEVLPGVWRSGYLAHEQGPGGPAISPDALPANAAARPVPVRKGGAVFMHRCTPHRSTPNRTDITRWSLDLRYQPAGTPTGRPFHPEFVARSRANPEAVLRDHAEWCRRWEEALEKSRGVRAHRV